jgi:hypothetical protein
MKIKWLLIIVILGIVLLNLRTKKAKHQNDISLKEFKTINPSLQVFERDIRFALEFLLQNEAIIDDILSDLNEPEKAEVLAIVFPEIIRWNEFQDVIEISANRALYVNGGSKIGDFSLGSFQMKPSFIEALEKYISQNTDLVDVENIILNSKIEKENRKERMARLENFEWQLKYAHTYWIVANHKFRNLKFQNKQAQIRFFATAYNTGFMKPITEIKAWETRQIFPYGNHHKESQMAFANFSIEFLNNYNSYFNN